MINVWVLGLKGTVGKKIRKPQVESKWRKLP